jgi:hypothetical protein
MDQKTELEMMGTQVVALVVVVVSFVVSRLRRFRGETETIPYGPRTEGDLHRQRTLQMIYNYNDAECIAMLRMRRAPFFLYAACLEVEALY